MIPLFVSLVNSQTEKSKNNLPSFSDRAGHKVFYKKDLTNHVSSGIIFKRAVLDAGVVQW